MNFPRLVVAGAHSGAGKTTFSLAIMAALARRGFAVHPYKVGPDYIDPSFHRAAAGRFSRNLDAWLLPAETLARLFRPEPEAQGEPIAIIEGVMGLFDGQGADSLGSTAHVAALLKTPVILLINGEGISLSAAALVSGYAKFRPHPRLNDLRLAGALINRLSGPSHYALLRRCVEESTAVPCLGWMPKNAFPSLPGRHLGLIPAQETDRLAEYLAVLAEAAEQYLDIDGLLDLARSAPPLPDPLPAGQPRSFPSSDPGGRPRIGLARDEAFSFYYQDNLELLEELGADLVPFSPLRDTRLPADLDGLYLGGGFPEVFAGELEANRDLRAEIATVLEAGLPAYAECGGMLYLCTSLAIPAENHNAPARQFSMVGFFPEQAEMTGRLQPFGYVTLTLRQDCPLGPAGTRLPAHEFHYARLIGPETPVESAFLVFTAAKTDGRAWDGGLLRRNTLGMFPHLHFHACPEAAARFIGLCRQYRLRKGAPA